MRNPKIVAVPSIDGVHSQRPHYPIDERLQKVLDKALYAGGRPAAQRLRNFLNGTWLGEPLHVVLTDIPLGAWSVAGPPPGSPAALKDWTRTGALFKTYGAVTTKDTVLLGFGLASAVGTLISGGAADRWGARRTVVVAGGLALLAYLAFSLSAPLGPARAILVTLPAILLWGLGSWGLITAQQARLVALAPALAPVSLSMNSSAIYLGSAMGAAAGALVIADGATERLSWVAAGFGLAALLSVLLSGSGTSSRG